MSNQRIVVWLVASVGCVSSYGLLLKVFRWVLGAGRDVARSYIILAFGLLTLNCLRGGIGGGIVPSNVYWNMGPRCPFALTTK